jgi:hypothetical protein
MFYNGNVKMEPGAVVCRVSPSFVRFGTFQLPVSRGGMQVRFSDLSIDLWGCYAERVPCLVYWLLCCNSLSCVRFGTL